MPLNSLRKKITTLNTYLLISLFFFIPFSVSIGTVVSLSILAGWLFIADFKNDFKELKSNRVLIACWLFIALHIIGLLWTEDMDWGIYTLRKEWRIFIIPIFMLYARKEYIHYYISAFILSMSISEFIVYGIWFELIPPFLHASVENPLPFIGHITYNPFLTVSIYLLANSLLFSNNLSSLKKVFYLIFLTTMTINMFITGGRSGQAMFFFAIFVLSFQYFQGQRIKGVLISLCFIISIFTIAYSSSDIFHQRMNMAVHAATNYENNKMTSTGQRITFTLNSLDIFYEHPLTGVGTGDFLNEYAKMNNKNTPSVVTTDNPHNMYTLEMVQFGLLGLISILWIFYSQISHALKNPDKFLARLGVTLPLLYFILCFGESYLLGHGTSLLFAIFSSFIYKNYPSKIPPPKPHCH